MNCRKLWIQMKWQGVVFKNGLARMPTNFKWDQNLEPNHASHACMKRGGERQDYRGQSYTKYISNANSMCQRFLAMCVKETLMELSGNNN